MSGNNKSRHSKKAYPYEVCEFWENTAALKEERKRDIKETVEWMSERLNEILEILKDDDAPPPLE